eukprot:EG_transcript_10698
MFDCKVEPVDCDADDYDCDAVDAIAHFSKRLGSLNNSDAERRALTQFVRDRGHLAPAFCDAVCAAIAARPPQRRYLWYLLDHLVREVPEPYVQLFRRHLPQLEGHFPFLESPINLAHLLHKWRDVFHCPAVERCDVACQTTAETKPLTPLDIEVKKMQLKLKQWQDSELRREDEKLETASAWMLESHRKLYDALVDGAAEYDSLARQACARLERAFEFSGMDLERGHEEATEVAVRYQLMAQQEAERAQLQRLETQRLRKLQARVWLHRDASLMEQLECACRQVVPLVEQLECACRQAVQAEEREQWAVLSGDFQQGMAKILPAVHHLSEPPKLLAVSSNGGAEPRLLPAKRPPVIPEIERRKRRRPLSSGKAPSGSQEGGPRPPAPPPDDDPQGDDAQHRPRTRNVQSRLDEARLKAEGLQFTAGLLQSTRDSEDLSLLYGQHFDRKVRKACAWHERSITPEWDFSTAVFRHGHTPSSLSGVDLVLVWTFET